MWRRALGEFGVWATADELTPEFAAETERLGYGAIWIGRADGEWNLIGHVLAATTGITIATAVVNIWRSPASSVATEFHRLDTAHPGRLLLGLGVGHPETNGASYHSPFAAMNQYLDQLDTAEVPPSRRILAALGPKMLKLAGVRAAGAHPYLVPIEHTRAARVALGADALLVPEQRVMLALDSDEAHAIARAVVAGPLRRANYASNLRRLGFGVADLAGAPSARLLDRLVPHGDPPRVTPVLRDHLLAGADYVAVHLVTRPGGDRLAGYRALARSLFATDPPSRDAPS